MEQRRNVQPQQVCLYAAAAAVLLQSRGTLCDPADGSPPYIHCMYTYNDVCVCVCRHIRVSQVVQLVKSMSANAGDQEMRVQSLGQEDPPE